MQPTNEIFVQLIQQHKGIIYKISRAYAGATDREDLSQEIIYNLWKSYKGFDQGFKFTTWMYRVALNVAISYHRKNRRVPSISPLSENTVIYDNNAHDAAELETQFEIMFQLISNLKEIDRSIMLLYLEDKSYRDIAEITGISESNVATRMNRIRDKLKSKIHDIRYNDQSRTTNMYELSEDSSQTNKVKTTKK